MDIIVQNLHFVGPISLALVPVSIIGLIILKIKQSRQ